MDPLTGFAIVVLLTGIIFASVLSNRNHEPHQPHNRYPHEHYPQQEYDAPHPYRESPYYEEQDYYRRHHYGPYQHRPHNRGSSLISILMLLIVTVIAIVLATKSPAFQHLLGITSQKNVEKTQPPRVALAGIESGTEPSYPAIKPDNPILSVQETPNPHSIDAVPVRTILQEQEPYWVIWLHDYETIGEAQRLQDAFQQRPINIAILPNGRYLAFIHFDTYEACDQYCKDMNRHWKDLKPYGISAKLTVKDIAPVELVEI